MLLKRNRFFITDSRLTLTAASFPAQTVRIPIPRVAPYALEWLMVTITVTMASAVTSGLVGWAFMNLLKRVQLGNIPNSQGKPSNVVDISGQSLLQFVGNEGLNLDAGTLSVLAANNLPNMISGGVYQLTYAIPMCPPFFTDGLRPRCLLPIHTYAQDPILVMDFAGATEMSGTANPFSAAVLEVWGVRAEMPDAIITKINATGGFMNWDLLEQQYAPIASLTNVQQKFTIPTPGAYSGIQIVQLKGGATQTPGDLTTLGGAGIGAEGSWSIKGAGKDLLEESKAKHMAVLNDMSKPYNGAAVFADLSGAAYVQNANSFIRFGGALSTGRAIQDPSSFYFDFASDGITDVRDLGSLLDTNPYAARGLDVSLFAPISTSATTTKPNAVLISGRRFYGDLTTFGLLGN